MFQYRQVRIHEPFHAILYAALLLASKLAGRYRARNAFLKTGFGKFVDSCRESVSAVDSCLLVNRIAIPCQQCGWQSYISELAISGSRFV
jgi:hypothetical protein